jgi:hypothetical protein
MHILQIDMINRNRRNLRAGHPPVFQILNPYGEECHDQRGKKFAGFLSLLQGRRG